MTVEKIATYIMTAILFGIAIYLHSSFVAGATVILIAIEYSKDILLKLQENQKIKELETQFIAHIKHTSARLEEVEKTLYSTANRVKETLGEI